VKKIVVVVIVAALAAAGYLLLRPGAPPPELPVADPGTVRSIDAGAVIGYVDRRGSQVWKGIPFAAPPLGELRWRAPQPPPAWTGVREALATGPACPQLASPLAGTEADDTGMAGSEDCLYLNVWAPPGAARAPVMLWLHGGGNSIGTGGTYDGSVLASRHGVVVVTMNYRLGPLGWFAHPDLRRGDPLDDSGNYGTLDVVRALEWTRDNIAAFGGDPGNVTLFGESAGAFNTLAMMASPLAAGLFHRAIVQSGGFATTAMAAASDYAADGGHANSAQEIVNRLLVTDGTVPELDAARGYQSDMSPESVREYLHGKSAQDIFAVFSSGSTFAMIDVPNNLGDGYVLPAVATESIFSDADNHNVVPVILGTNRDEMALFLAMNPQFQSRFLWLFPRLRNEEAYLRAVRYSSLAWKARGVDSLANYMTAAGNRDVYAYRFDWDEQGTRFGYDLSKAFGAAHGLEIAFVFGDFPSGGLFGAMYADSPNKEALSASMMSYWTQFAITGDPGSGRDGSEVRWLPWGVDGARSILLDTVDDGGIRMDHREWSIEGIKAELAADPDVDAEERCRIYVYSFAMFGMDEAEYRDFGPDGCAGFDPARLLR
jgi:para-nitrobenzyl esterase